MTSQPIRTHCPVSIVLAIILVAGCQSSSDLPPIDRPLIVVANDPNTLWQRSKKVLTDRGFTIDRFDRRGEVIDTFPLTSKQWFEFWRHDVVDDDSLAEASLQTIQRRVRLSLASTPAGQTRLDCQVTVLRLASHPGINRRVTRAKDIFAGSSGQMPTLQSWADRRNYPQQWVTLGRDETLETAILRQINTAILKSD